MADFERRPLVLHERWRLRPELRLDGTSVVAIQRWVCREAEEAVASSDGYARWWAEYQSSLAEWDRLLELVGEWSTVDIDIDINDNGDRV